MCPDDALAACAAAGIVGIVILRTPPLLIASLLARWIFGRLEKCLTMSPQRCTYPDSKPGRETFTAAPVFPSFY
ncbi:hypothetical protein OZ911_24995 [Pseudomonas fortuita]|uniref:Uncharacterized protein n=1 Tax=Pseudomonas fortuita TaxID=3233375 RepID=A0ACD4PIF3_9PSED|nr:MULTISPECIES: hypothetical protein [Pseudomonas]WAP66669.1 hypothetical protein OZ911_24995 [Pseudomonas putida]